MAGLGSPEDHPSWGKSVEDGQTNLACSVCRNTIVLWHCADAGCPWCAKCSFKLKKEKEK